MDAENLHSEINKTLTRQLEDETLRTRGAHVRDVIDVRKREDRMFVGSDDINLFSRAALCSFSNITMILY